ncbi:hypothetical protein KIN20_034986 [Parelaphostrongylus tenuis]|uniref:Uncharacterized protein n=1 Tax=Parelaphostrongylus tenuis TaxID=148309 RepID=A0AAD5RAJ2_PARTN|nr:hypothetical protein KIN20_034986 [Parelaphostrongylus tenuis]
MAIIGWSNVWTVGEQRKNFDAVQLFELVLGLLGLYDEITNNGTMQVNNTLQRTQIDAENTPIKVSADALWPGAVAALCALTYYR